MVTKTIVTLKENMVTGLLLQLPWKIQTYIPQLKTRLNEILEERSQEQPLREREVKDMPIVSLEYNMIPFV